MAKKPKHEPASTILASERSRNLLRLHLDEAVHCLQRIDEQQEIIDTLAEHLATTIKLDPRLFKKLAQVLHQGTTDKTAQWSEEILTAVEALRV